MASSPEEAEQIAKKNLSNELDCCDLSAREAQKNYQYDNTWEPDAVPYNANNMTLEQIWSKM